MAKIPRMSRTMRRHIIRLGRRSWRAGDCTAVSCGQPPRTWTQQPAGGNGAGRRALDGREGSRPVSPMRESMVSTTSVTATAHRRSTMLFAAALLSCCGARPRTSAGRGPPGRVSFSASRWGARVGPTVAVCTMGRALALIGARLGMPKPIVLCPWPTRRARLRVLAADSPSRSARERGRARALQRRGRRPPQPEDRPRLDAARPAAPHRHARQEREVLPGRRARRAHRAPSHDGRRTARTPRSSASCSGCSRRRYGRARRIHLIVDNYGIHSASAHAQAPSLTFGGRIVLHFLPPYCPDANRIERVWQDLHANVTRNHRCKTMSQLLANARRYLDSYRWKRAVAKRVVARAA